MTLSPEERAILQRAWLDSIDAEIAHRAGDSETARQEATEHLLATLEIMAQRFKSAARPGDSETAEQLRALIRARDWAEAEKVRIRQELSPAEVVALMFATGDRAAGRRWLAHCASRFRSGRG